MIKIMNNTKQPTLDLKAGDMVIEDGKDFYLIAENFIDMDEEAYLISMPFCEVIATFPSLDDLNNELTDYIFGDLRKVKSEDVNIILN